MCAEAIKKKSIPLDSFGVEEGIW